MTNTAVKGLSTDFSKESVDLCQTPEVLVQSALFTKALEKILEPQDVQYLQAIVEKRLKQHTLEGNAVVRDATQGERWDNDLTKQQQAFLDTMAQSESLLSKFNDIINSIEYVSKKKGADMSKKIDLPHFDTKGNADAKKVLAWLQCKNSTEAQVSTFCGITIDELTETQQKLFDKLTPKQREELTQQVAINKQQGQIEFLQIKKAITDSNITTNVTTLGNGWELPRDVDHIRHDDGSESTLDPKKSDYDAMILQMIGETNKEKVENFRLLTGMSGWYQTAKKYNNSNPRFVSRRFKEDDRSRSELSDINNCHVRLVRSL